MPRLLSRSQELEGCFLSWGGVWSNAIEGTKDSLRYFCSQSAAFLFSTVMEILLHHSTDSQHRCGFLRELQFTGYLVHTHNNNNNNHMTSIFDPLKVQALIFPCVSLVAFPGPVILFRRFKTRVLVCGPKEKRTKVFRTFRRTLGWLFAA